MVYGFSSGPLFQPDERVQVDFSGMTIQGVLFSENVKKALGTVVRQRSTGPPVDHVELVFSFRGVKRLDVGEDRVHPA